MNKALLALCLLPCCLLVIGCGGTQLTPEEQARYDKLNKERQQISSERPKLVKQVKKEFEESGRLEKKKRAITKSALSCGFQVTNQKFGPLPFNKQKNKHAYLGSGKSSSMAHCQQHSLKVK